MSEPENITVRCCEPACKQVYQTSRDSFEKQECRCPGCGSTKAQEQA